MARIFMEGFEANPYFHPWMRYGDGAFSGTKRSGNFAMSLGAAGSRSHPITVPDPTASEWYVRFAWRVSSLGSYTYWRVGNDTGQSVMELRTSGFGAMVLYVQGTNRGTFSLPFLIATNTWYLIELHVRLGVSDGLVEARIEGQNFLSYTGDTAGTGAVLKSLLLGIHNTGSSLFDDLAINDTTGSQDNGWCGDGHIQALRPTGGGDITEWIDNVSASGRSFETNYPAVSETVADGDATYVMTTSSGAVDLYALDEIENVAPLEPGDSIKFVQIIATARALTADGDQLCVGTKLGDTQGEPPNTPDWAAEQTLMTSYNSFYGPILPLSPNDTPWNEDTLNNLQAGIKSVIA